jgi:hypothetical protein
VRCWPAADGRPYGGGRSRSPERRVPFETTSASHSGVQSGSRLAIAPAIHCRTADPVPRLTYSLGGRQRVRSRRQCGMAADRKGGVRGEANQRPLYHPTVPCKNSGSRTCMKSAARPPNLNIACLRLKPSAVSIPRSRARSRVQSAQSHLDLRRASTGWSIGRSERTLLPHTATFSRSLC